MTVDMNRVRNADFAQGQKKPTGWNWRADGPVRWQIAPASGNGIPAGIRIEAEEQSRGFWSQRVRCKKDQHYRIEAVVSCDCEPKGETDADAANAGLVMGVRFIEEKGAEGVYLETLPLLSGRAFTLRTFCKTEEATRSLEVTVGLRDARGGATVHEVRVLPVMAPEYCSHPAAATPPPYACPPPVVVKTACVVTGMAERPLVGILNAMLGEANVSVCPPGNFKAGSVNADAVLFPDERPPASIRNIAALKQLAGGRIVWVSTRGLAALSGGAVVMRAIRQNDDPLNARLTEACFVTRGFALRDIIPFAEEPAGKDVMIQRQFRTNPAYRQFCSTHGFEELAEAVTDSDATSDKPIALIREAQGGALIAMDLEPAERGGTLLEEAGLAVHLLASAMGCRQPHLGHPIAPARTSQGLNDHLCDLVERFPVLEWLDQPTPPRRGEPVLIGLGRRVESFGLPVAQPKAIVLRTGIAGDDWGGVYGAYQWVKNLVRPEPFVSPYITPFAKHARLVWLPAAAPLFGWSGWNQASPPPAPRTMDVEYGAGTVHAHIDITHHEGNETVVQHDASSALGGRLTDLLPPLCKALATKTVFARTPQGAESYRHVDDIGWRWLSLAPKVTHAPESFADPVYEAARKAGGACIRISLPRVPGERLGQSLWQVEYSSLLLELTVGLILGAVVVNRSESALRISWPKAHAALLGNAVIRSFDVAGKTKTLGKGAVRTVTVPSGAALVAIEA